MTEQKKCWAVILAAGIGARMGGSVTKQKLNMLGRPLLYYSLAAFEACPDVDGIVVVTRSEEIDFARSSAVGISKLRAVVEGGECRAESARLGFLAISEDAELVAIHDAARALITPEAVSAVIKEASRLGAASAVSAVTDTVKVVGKDGAITGTLDRDCLRRAETPQVFLTELYKRALEHAPELGSVTDDNMLVERLGAAIGTVDVGRNNIKITVPEDLGYAEYLLKERGWEHA